MENRETATIIKVSAIGILGGLFSFLTFYFFNYFLTSFDFSFLWFVLFSALLFLIFFILQALFVRDIVILSGLSILQGLIPFAVFFPYLQANTFWYFIGSALLVFTGFLLAGSKSGFDNLENSILVKFFSISDSIVAKSFIGLLIVLMIFSYFHMFHLDNFSDDNGQALFDKVLESVEPALKIWFPGVTFSMNTGDALDKMTSVQVQRSKVDLLKQGVNYEELPQVAQQEILNNAKDKIQLTLENLTGKSIVPDQPLNIYLFESFDQWLSSFSDAAKTFFEIGAFIFLFFIIKGISFLVYIPVKAISFLIFKLLTLIGFADIGIKEVSKEQIII